MSNQPKNPPADKPEEVEDLFPETEEAGQAKPAAAEKPAEKPAEQPAVTPPPAEPPRAVPQAAVIQPLEESRLAKFMRTALRLFTLSLVMFAAGFLLAYFLLYQPTTRQLDTRSTSLDTTTAELEAKTAAYDELKAQYDEILASATKIEAQASLAHALRALDRAFLGIERKNNVVVRNQLKAARIYVDELLPYLEGIGEKEQAAELADLMKTAETELVRDPQAVGPAVKNLMDALDSLNETLSLE